MELKLDDFLKVFRELGIPGILLLMLGWWMPKIGRAIYDGVAWSGPNFLVPIREAIIGNFSVLTGFIQELRAQQTIVVKDQQRMSKTLDNLDDGQTQIAHDVERIKGMAKAMAKSLAGDCEKEECPLIKSAFDSDSNRKGNEMEE